MPLNSDFLPVFNVNRRGYLPKGGEAIILSMPTERAALRWASEIVKVCPEELQATLIGCVHPDHPFGLPLLGEWSLGAHGTPVFMGSEYERQ